MQTIHLQNIGKAKAKPAQEFKIGEFMLWNYGSQSKVISITKETKAFITFEIMYPLGGSNDWSNTGISERRLKKSRLVGIGSEEIVKKYHKNYSS